MVSEFSGPTESEESDKCGICGSVIENLSLNDHLNAYHPSDDDHYCCICNKHFSEIKRLKSHIRIHRYVVFRLF
ncbi:hypothetical protein NQ314_005131 [Rhamnusium bicolor]|uniref:C2H2-type domain-containing protein n=1 Tax=Rhamnusium bicolor TaxID=1586634 RepID=A0AAV8ZJM0_9CUCU|nr:hypothetical protein NQ314_005131 [Rhamnusium bicolor]